MRIVRPCDKPPGGLAFSEGKRGLCLVLRDYVTRICSCDASRPSASNWLPLADYPFGAKSQYGPTVTSIRHPEPYEGRPATIYRPNVSAIATCRCVRPANMSTTWSGRDRLTMAACPMIGTYEHADDAVCRRHCASGEGRNFQSLARPRRRARRSPVPPLDQLRVPPARHTLFAPQRARKPCCKLIIIAAALCAARASAQNPPSDDLQRESFCSAKLCCNEEFRWL